MHLTPLKIKLNLLSQTFKNRELLTDTTMSAQPYEKKVPRVKLARITYKTRSRPYKKLTGSKYSRKRLRHRNST